MSGWSASRPQGIAAIKKALQGPRDDTEDGTELFLTVLLAAQYCKKSVSIIESMESRSSFATTRRTELFDAVVDLFVAEGFAHLTLDMIAARLRCSKSTLYTLAGSKEQLVTAATVHFFKRATEQVETSVADVTAPRERIAAYLAAVGEALSITSDSFMTDLDAFVPAREVYERNTRIAARRVQQLITDGVATGDFRAVHAAFAADLAATMMARIQQGGVRAATGLDDANAYRELAAILTAGVSA